MATRPKKAASELATGASRKQGEAVQLGDRTIPIARLHLDPDNPRHPPLKSDAEVIAQLCKDEQVLELAKDIVEMQSVSPLEVLGVVPYEGHVEHYITVEGNRRTCALLLLVDPRRAPTSELKDAFKKLATNASIPREVKVHIFADRGAAKPWIARRHLGARAGRGTRSWDTTQQARAAEGDTSTSAADNALALAILDRLSEAGLVTSAEREQVSLTTITRYVGTPGVRAILGLGGGRKLEYTHDAKEVDRALLRLVRDSIQKQDDGTSKVNSRTNSKQRVAYAHELKSEGVAPSRALLAPADPPPVAPALGAAGAGGKRNRSSTSPDKLRTLFDRSLLVKSSDPTLRRLRDEAVSLDVDEFPFAANYLLRALIEQTMTLYAKKNAKGRWSEKLTDEALTHLCHDVLKANGVSGKALMIVGKAAGSAAQPFSLHSLGHAVHGGSIPTKKALRAVSDTWRPSLEAMLKEL